MKPNMQGKQSKSSEIWNEIIKRVLTHGPTRLESAHLMIHGRQVVGNANDLYSQDDAILYCMKLYTDMYVGHVNASKGHESDYRRRSSWPRRHWSALPNIRNQLSRIFAHNFLL
jgi:hypothetical protein